MCRCKSSGGRSVRTVRTHSAWIESIAGVYIGYLPLKSVALVPSIRGLLPQLEVPLKPTAAGRGGHVRHHDRQQQLIVAS